MTSSIAMCQVRAKLAGRTWRPAGALFVLEGTAYPGAPAPPQFITNDGKGTWCGFASGVAGGAANTQDGLWDSRMVGYPAKTYPMWPSVQTGRANLGAAMVGYANEYHQTHGTYEGMVITWSMWSQAVMAALQCLLLDILPEDGPLHYLLPYLYRMYFFGDPFRCPGIAHGNTELLNIPLPPNVDGQVTGGIGGPLDYTPDVANLRAPDGKFLIYSFVNENELYADAPVGATPWTSEPSVGEVEYLFFKIVMYGRFQDYLRLAELLGKPIGDIEALVNTGEFFGAGQNAGHYQYFAAMVAAIGDLIALGESLDHQDGGF